MICEKIFFENSKNVLELAAVVLPAIFRGGGVCAPCRAEKKFFFLNFLYFLKCAVKNPQKIAAFLFFFPRSKMICEKHFTSTIFTSEILQFVSDWVCIFDSINYKHFFSPVWCITLIKHISFILRYSDFITYFKFRFLF